MLTPEAAQKQLEAWSFSKNEEGTEKLLESIGKLPKKLRPCAFGLIRRAADGTELSGGTWQENHAVYQKHVQAFDKLPRKERVQIFKAFLPKLADALELTWEFLKRGTYQTGYSRKSFRVPNRPELTLDRRLDWMNRVVTLPTIFQPEVITTEWIAAWCPHVGHRFYYLDQIAGPLLAAVIEQGGAEGDKVFEILRQSALNEHEIGAMGRHVPRALLSASRQDGWELIEKMLLAAQRQEGLRQVILETLDECHPDAFRRLLQVIHDENLMRFSAVVRAVDVWHGMLADSDNTRLIKTTIQNALKFLNDDSARQEALQGKDPEALFLALWATGFDDADQSLVAAAARASDSQLEIRFVAITHLAHLCLPECAPHLTAAMADADLRIALLALEGNRSTVSGDDDEMDDESDEASQEQEGQNGQKVDDGRFEAVETLLSRLPEKEFKLPPLVWAWTARTAKSEHVVNHLFTALGSRPPSRLLPHLKHYSPYQRSRLVTYLADQKKWDRETRDTLLDLAGDSAADVRSAAIGALGRNPLSDAECLRLESYLTRTSSDLRKGITTLLVTRSDAEAIASAQRLLASKQVNQRQGGLELLRQLAEANRERSTCIAIAKEWVAGRGKISAEEQTQLTAILESEREVITLDNALGLMDPTLRTPRTEPKKHKVEVITPAAIKILQTLDELIHKHRETVVKWKNWRGEESEQVLGTIRYLGSGNQNKKASIQEQFEQLPLAEVWSDWYEKRPKAQRDSDGLEIARAEKWAGYADEWDWEWGTEWLDSPKERQPLKQLLLGGNKRLKLKYADLVNSLMGWIRNRYPHPNEPRFWMDVLETVFTLVPESEMKRLDRDFKEDPKKNYDEEWREARPIQDIHSQVSLEKQTSDADVIRWWRLLRWQDQPFDNAKRDRPSFDLMTRAYRLGQATQTDLMDHLLGPGDGDDEDGRSFDSLAAFTAPRLDKSDVKLLQEFPEIREMVDRCRARILDVELARGEAATAATHAALALNSVFGTEILVRILTTLGKHNFKISDRWSDARLARLPVFTHLVSITYPGPGETPETFAKQVNAAIKAGAFPQERLLELAFLAPQWTRFIERAFNWEGFAEGLYWFLAHMQSIGGRDEEVAIAASDAEPDDSDEVDDTDEDDDDDAPPKQEKKLSAWERLILDRTPLTDEERSFGAVDVDWFHRIYQQLTPKRWQAMAEAARFASTANQAKKAKFIADVLLGKANRADLIASIRTKKLKEQVRLLGLLPLATGAKREKDLLERYEVLQEYRRYARTLTMTKEAALHACDIGMQNLARTAGYLDPLRLEWALEAKSTKDLAAGPVSVTKGDVTLTLSLDERAKPELSVTRAGKAIKSMPQTHKKEPVFVELTERAQHLKKQASRVKFSLETAMCRGDTLTGAELGQLSEHALLWPLLQRLVLVVEDPVAGSNLVLGYPAKKGKVLLGVGGAETAVKPKDLLRIAHPSDLLKSGAWDKWQHDCFTAERLQPFKQIFRELYVITAQEKKDGTHSKRYTGQQVNPTQANALWGQRGWKTEDGVWKTFHDLGLTASVSFTYGGGTPLEVEGLTINQIEFTRRDDYKPIKLTEVPPRVFSEVMRDMDLVVSVAHRGGVDPEASASTVEMRAALLRETCQLLGLKNVRIKSPHVLIKGTLGEYSVHLGSGTVHRMPGGSLCIVPVHAQHRGRIFLPFADDDPRTAEVISKVMLLARDHEIQDPTILDQLRAMG